MKMQPLFFIVILVVLLTMIVLESEVMQNQSQRAVAAQTRQ
jgi:hypothetical protein